MSDSIWNRRWALGKERREFMKSAMSEFDKSHRQKMAVLYAECGAVGHNWRFTHVGPVGNPWYTCTQCGLSEARASE